MRKFLLSLVLLGGSTCSGSSLFTQADACLGAGNCSNAASGTLHAGVNDFNTFAQSAVSSFGILHVSASSNFSETNSYALSLGVVSFTEDLTITSASHANGTPGILHFGYFIDGTNTTSGQGNAFLQVVVRDYAETDLNNPLVNYVKDYNNSSVAGFFTTTAMPFVYGTKFELSVSMQATAGSLTDNGLGGYSLVNSIGKLVGSGTSNFIDTLVVDQLQTSDGSDNPVADSIFSADSGTSYTQAGVAATPEPGTWLLMSLAIPALLCGRKLRQRLGQN